VWRAARRLVQGCDSTAVVVVLCWWGVVEVNSISRRLRKAATSCHRLATANRQPPAASRLHT